MNQQSSRDKGSFFNAMLNGIERVGNALPDPAMLFLFLMLVVWALSGLLAPYTFTEIDPRSGEILQVNSLLTGSALAQFLSNMVPVFTGFAPLGIVLVAMLGIGVAEHSGFINASLKVLLGVTPRKFLTPMVILVGILSHTAVDAGYVLVIPLGGVIFHACGRHPLSGIAAAFAGVAGGFSANFVPSAIDPLLQGFTQSSAQLLDPNIQVNPLCNFYFTALSSLLIVGVGWLITERIIDRRLENVPFEADEEHVVTLNELSSRERKAFAFGLCTMLSGFALLVMALIPENSPLRGPAGELTSFAAPIMKSIVPLIFLLFALPGVVYGALAGTFKSTKDIVDSMSRSMHGMSHYIVMAFFCALFIDSFGRSNIGVLLALKGAMALKALALPAQLTVLGLILLVALLNLFIGSASAKWALVGPIVVPMLMQVGLSPELTQAAYRVGDSASNVVTPLNPYFPLVVVFCQRYVKSTGIGTLASLMLPYTAVFLVAWTLLLLAYWGLGLPLGLQAGYVYP